MPLSVNTPTVGSTVDSDVSLNNTQYTFRYRYNERNSRLYLDILLGEQVLVTGIKLIENHLLLFNYVIPQFDHGDLVVVKYKDADSESTLGNIGIGLTYELLYFSNSELGRDG